MRSLQTLGEQTKPRPIPPDDLDSIRSLRAENEKRPAERVGASITHQRNEPVWPLAEIYSARPQEHPRAGRHHDCRTARRSRRRSSSAMSAVTRTTAPPTSISTRFGLSATASSAALFATSVARRAAARRHPKSCEGETSSDRAKAEIFTSGSTDAAIARSLKSSDHRRRSPTGAPSSRSALTSTNWLVLALRIGVDIEVASMSKRYHAAAILARTAPAVRLRCCSRRSRPSPPAGRAAGRPCSCAACAVAARRPCRSRFRAWPVAARRNAVGMGGDEGRRQEPGAHRCVIHAMVSTDSRRS